MATIASLINRAVSNGDDDEHMLKNMWKQMSHLSQVWHLEPNKKLYYPLCEATVNMVYRHLTTVSPATSGKQLQ